MTSFPDSEFPVQPEEICDGDYDVCIVIVLITGFPDPEFPVQPEESCDGDYDVCIVIVLLTGFPDPEFPAVPRDGNASFGRCVLHGTVLSG